MLTELRRLHDEDFFAALVGGALRDTLLGRPVKDFDVFFYDQRHDDHDSKVARLSLALGQSFQELVGPPVGYESPLNAEICRIFNFTGGWQMVEVSKWPGLGALVERVDFGICQVGMDYRGRLHYGSRFFKDVENQTFTVTPNGIDRMERTRSRWARLSEKFPEYRLIT